MRTKIVYPLLAIVAACHALSCSQHEVADAGMKASADATEPEAGVLPVAEAMHDDASGLLDATAPAVDAWIPLDSALAVQPAPMACNADASDEAGGNYCPPPLSMCGDTAQLVYFDWGTCVSGSCVWPQFAMGCPGGYCSKGACISQITAPAPQ